MRPDLVRRFGWVERVAGLTVESRGPAGVAIGTLCEVEVQGTRVPCEVVGFDGPRCVLAPLGPIRGIAPGCRVVETGMQVAVGCGRGMLGRVLDGLGRPLDGGAMWEVEDWRPLGAASPVPAMVRRKVCRPLPTGIRAIDGLFPLGVGQRVGLFAGSGVGKSTLLGMIARHAQADVVVAALIGERSREVREFVEDVLGPEGMMKAVVVVALATDPAMVRVKAAFTATAVAEWFRDQGLDVLLLLDSITRLAMAQREVGLASGEPPTSKGYPPSAFAMLPAVLERAGMGSEGMGSITGIYTVLVDGDDLLEPVADAVRSILDGHIVLSRELAARGHYPPIDPLASISRVADRVVSDQHVRASMVLREAWASLMDAEDALRFGTYRHGSDERLDRVLAMADDIRRFLRQDQGEYSPWEDTVGWLLRMAERLA